MARRLIFVATAGFWVATLAIAFALGRLVPNRPPEESRGVQLESKDFEPELLDRQTSDANMHALAELQSENDTLRRQVDALEEQREQLHTERYALRFEQAVEAVLDQPDPGSMATRWSVDSTHVLSQSDQIFGGLEETLGLMIDFAVWGENGVEYLTGVLTDESRSEDERQLAYDILCWVPSSKALDALLELDCTAPQGQGKPDYVDTLARQVTQLPTADLAPHLSTLTRDLLRDLSDAGKLDDKETRVTAALAFRHGSTEAMEFATRPEVWQDPAGLLEWADIIHSPDAREFVQRGRNSIPNSSNGSKHERCWRLGTRMIENDTGKSCPLRSTMRSP